MSNEIAIPDYLKKITEANQKAAASLVTESGGGMPRVSLKGKKFRFNKNGEEIIATSDPIKVVIIGVQPDQGMAKTFYESGYSPGDTSPPDCSSMDGVKPDSWITSPQSPTCATCPQAKWGSATSMDGKKKSKACKDSKRLLITNKKNPGDADLYVLTVTVMSLKSLSEYGKELMKQSLPLSAVVTKISMDDESDFPKILFEVDEALPEDLGVPAMERAAKAEWLDDGGIKKIAGPEAEASKQVEQPKEEAPPAETETKVTANADNILDEWG